MAEKKKTDEKQAVRDAIDRAVEVCGGSYEKLAHATKSLTKWQIIRYHERGNVRVPENAEAIERATGGVVNRLEFFPTLIHCNPDVIATVRRMLGSP